MARRRRAPPRKRRRDGSNVNDCRKLRRFSSGPFTEPTDDVPDDLTNLCRRVVRGDATEADGQWECRVTPDLAISTSNFMVQTQVVSKRTGDAIPISLEYVQRSLLLDGATCVRSRLPSIYIRSRKSNASVQLFNTGKMVLTGHASLVTSIKHIHRFVSHLQRLYAEPLTYETPCVNSVIVSGLLPNTIKTDRIIAVHNRYAIRDPNFGGARISDTNHMANRWMKVTDDGTVRHAGGNSLKMALHDIKAYFYMLHACQT